jgi:hypothetical protein
MSLVAEYQELEKVHALCQRCYRSVSEQWQGKLAKFRQSLEILDGVVVVDRSSGTGADPDGGVADHDRYREMFEQLCIRHQQDIEGFFNGGCADAESARLPDNITLSGFPYGDGKYKLQDSEPVYLLQVVPSWWSTPTVYRVQKIFGRWQLCNDSIPVGLGKLGSDHSTPIGGWSAGGQASLEK